MTGGEQNLRGFYGTTAGFTLIEILLVLSMFCLILAMGYQSVVYTAQARTRVVDQVDQQQSLRGAHRTLNNVFSTNAPMSGTERSLRIELDQSDSRWLAGNSRLTLNLNSQGQLVAEVDNPVHRTILLTGLERASFRYFENNIGHSSWSNSTQPQLVSLQWSDSGRPINWKFLTGK